MFECVNLGVLHRYKAFMGLFGCYLIGLIEKKVLRKKLLCFILLSVYVFLFLCLMIFVLSRVCKYVWYIFWVHVFFSTGFYGVQKNKGYKIKGFFSLEFWHFSIESLCFVLFIGKKIYSSKWRSSNLK
jgi:hypothetical protein